MKALIRLSGLTMALLRNEVEDEAGSAEGAAATRTTAHIRPNLDGYQTSKSASGSSTKICGDEISLALNGATLDEAYEFVAGVTETKETDLRAKYGARNLGQQRMFLGNLIRGALQGKNEERRTNVKAAFDAAVPGLRKVVDARLAKAADEAAAAKQAKADAKAKEAAEKKAKAEANKPADAEKPAKTEKPAKAPKEPAKPAA